MMPWADSLGLLTNVPVAVGLPRGVGCGSYGPSRVAYDRQVPFRCRSGILSTVMKKGILRSRLDCGGLRGSMN